MSAAPSALPAPPRRRPDSEKQVSHGFHNNKTRRKVRAELEAKATFVRIPDRVVPFLVSICCGAIQVGILIVLYRHSWRRKDGFSDALSVLDIAFELGVGEGEVAAGIANLIERGVIERQPEANGVACYRCLAENWPKVSRPWVVRNPGGANIRRKQPQSEGIEDAENSPDDTEEAEVTAINDGEDEANDDRFAKRCRPLSITPGKRFRLPGIVREIEYHGTRKLTAQTAKGVLLIDDEPPRQTAQNPPHNLQQTAATSPPPADPADDAGVAALFNPIFKERFGRLLSGDASLLREFQTARGSMPIEYLACGIAKREKRGAIAAPKAYIPIILEIRSAWHDDEKEWKAAEKQAEERKGLQRADQSAFWRGVLESDLSSDEDRALAREFLGEVGG